MILRAIDVIRRENPLNPPVTLPAKHPMIATIRAPLHLVKRFTITFVGDLDLLYGPDPHYVETRRLSIFRSAPHSKALVRCFVIHKF